VIFEKVCIVRCSSAEWIARNGCCLEMMPSWCRQVNWGNCGINCVNCAVLCVKDEWKGQFCGLSKLRSLLRFSVRYDVTQEKSLSLTESVLVA